MKKISTHVFVMVMFFLGSIFFNNLDINNLVYANSSNVSYDNNNELLVEVSMQFLEHVFEGDFHSMFLKVSDNLYDFNVNEEVERFSYTWEILTRNLGEYKSITNMHLVFLPFMGTSDNVPTTINVLEYELGIMVIVIQFNDENEIFSFSIEVYPTPIDYKLVNNNYFKEIPIIVGSKEYPLDGILTLPHNIVNPPVAVLVHGSGQSDMNYTTSFIMPFRDIAHGLAENGIATIRYNKRFYQHPILPKDIGIREESLEDVNYAIEWAENNENLGDIYIIGHSLGGMLAPKIALENENVSGIVSLAGSPRRLEDIIIDQLRLQLEVSNVIEEEKEQIIKVVEQYAQKIKELRLGYVNEEYLNNVILALPVSYWISLNEINTPQIIEELDLPMLILQGEKDLQVFADVDFIKWQHYLSNRDNVTFILYEGLNHTFMPHNELLGFGQFMVPGNVDYQVITDISNWINSLS